MARALGMYIGVDFGRGGGITSVAVIEMVVRPPSWNELRSDFKVVWSASSSPEEGREWWLLAERLASVFGSRAIAWGSSIIALSGEKGGVLIVPSHVAKRIVGEP